MLQILKRLIKGSFTYGFGSLSRTLIGFLLVPVYTRFLTTSDYGIVAVANSVYSIIGILLGMGLRSATIRHYYDYVDSKKEVREYVSTVFFFFLVVSLPIVTGLSLFGKPLFNALFSEVPFHPYIRLTLWAALFGTTGNIVLGLYRAREQAGRYVAMQMAKFVVSLGLIIYFVTILQQGAAGKIRGGFLAGLLFFFIFLFLTFQEGTFSFSAPKLKSALRYGLPLVPHLLTGWVINAADRIILARMTSLSEVGLYNLGYKIGMVLSLIAYAIYTAWSPIFFDTAKNDPIAKTVLSRIFTLYTVVISTLAGGVILFSREIIFIVAAKQFHAAYMVVPAVAVGYLFQGLYLMSVTPILYKEKTYVMPFLSGTAAAANIGLNILWIPQYGIMGAAYATLIAFALLFVSTHIVAQKFYKIPYAYGKISRIVLLLAGVYVANYFLDFQGILVPIAIKTGILLVFLSCMFLFRVVSLQELARIKGLLSVD